MNQHSTKKSFECAICQKKFLLQWRLLKHGLIHTEKTRHCKYILNEQVCPFEEVGCAFAHNIVKEDNIEELQIDEPNVESQHDDNEQDIEDIENDYEQLLENQCHLCKEVLSTKDELWYHVENNHVDYFLGMIEFAASNRSLI